MNIPIEEGIQTALDLVKEHQDEIDTIGFELELENLHFVLTNNCFRFGKNFYRQKMGVVMGNRLAPPFAILFMYRLETRYLATANKSPAFWVRYIDDIFGVWLHDAESLKQFHHSLNQFHPTIKFNLEHTGDTPSIPFLDTITEDGTITTEIYIEPAHSGVLLHHSSAHPRSTKVAVASSQMNRALRVSSASAGSSRSTETIALMLENNGYPNDMIVKSKKRATQRSSGQHQRKNRTAKDGVLSLPYISEEVTHRVRKAVVKSGLNIYIAQRSGPTLKSILTRSALEPPECPNQGDASVADLGWFLGFHGTPVWAGSTTTKKVLMIS